MGTSPLLSGASASRDRVSQLVSLVHDRWFDLDRVRFDASNGLFSLRFGEKRRGPFDKTLLVSGVLAEAIEDDSGIQLYDIDRVELDVQGSRLTLTSGFPLRLVLTLTPGWEVRVE